jgi:hypothetical protein
MKKLHIIRDKKILRIVFKSPLPPFSFKGGQVKYSLDITSNLLSHVRKNITISMMRI